jgi:hypothetical protein
VLRYGLRHSEALQVHKDLFKTDSFAILVVSFGGTNIGRMSSRPEFLLGRDGYRSWPTNVDTLDPNMGSVYNECQGSQRYMCRCSACG